MNRREPNPDRAEPYALAGRGLSSRGGAGAVPRAHWLPAAMQQPLRRPQVPAAASAVSAQMVQAAPESADSEATQDDWWNDLVDLTAVMVESAEQSGALARIQAASEQDFGALDASASGRDGSHDSANRDQPNPSATREGATAGLQPNAAAMTDGVERAATSFAASASARTAQHAVAEQAGNTTSHAFGEHAGSAGDGRDSSFELTSTATPAARDSRAYAQDDEARLAGRFAKRASGEIAAQAIASADHAAQADMATYGADTDARDRNIRGRDAEDAAISRERSASSQHRQSASPMSSARDAAENAGDDVPKPMAHAADHPKFANRAIAHADAAQADAAGRLSDRIDAMNLRLDAARSEREPASAGRYDARPSLVRGGEMGLPETAPARPSPTATISPPALDAASIAALLAPAPAASGPSISIDRVQVTVQAPASAKPAAAPAPTAAVARSAPAARGMGGAAGYRSPWASYFTRRD